MWGRDRVRSVCPTCLGTRRFLAETVDRTDDIVLTCPECGLTKVYRHLASSRRPRYG